jgi:hypothetical protein
MLPRRPKVKLPPTTDLGKPPATTPALPHSTTSGGSPFNDTGSSATAPPATPAKATSEPPGNQNTGSIFGGQAGAKASSGGLFSASQGQSLGEQVSLSGKSAFTLTPNSTGPSFGSQSLGGQGPLFNKSIFNLTPNTTGPSFGSQSSGGQGPLFSKSALADASFGSKVGVTPNTSGGSSLFSGSADSKPSGIFGGLPPIPVFGGLPPIPAATVKTGNPPLPVPFIAYQEKDPSATVTNSYQSITAPYSSDYSGLSFEVSMVIQLKKVTNPIVAQEIRLHEQGVRVLKLPLPPVAICQPCIERNMECDRHTAIVHAKNLPGNPSFPVTFSSHY